MRESFPCVCGDPNEQLLEKTIESCEMRLSELEGKAPLEAIKYFSTLDPERQVE
jgi:hypothetical protein